ncbi:MAG TPA: hypothetical protein VHW23_30460 [Kofleriaceae bacterium]|jgi:hypothetical protein|nr:hypothetical protein [Kofleriaceae bacterium]
MPSTLDFSHLPPQLQTLPRVDGRPPPNAPIVALGLSKEGAAQLTLNAAKLTRADLEDLARDPVSTQARLGLTVDDVNSVIAAFTEPMQIGNGAAKGFSLNISKCCCTPCCCAASVPVDQSVR